MSEPRRLMPGHFEFDSQHKILLLVAEGHIEDPEIMAAKDSIAAQVKRLKPSAGITDLSAVTDFDVSSEAMRAAARQPSPYPEAIPTFIVAPLDHLFGLARMYELFGSLNRTNLKVVRSRQEALAALGAPDAKFEPVDSE